MATDTINSEQAWRTHKTRLLAFIKSKINSMDDAEDILNDVFTALLRKIEETDTPTNMTAWLYQVTRNKIIDFYRGNRSLEELPVDLADEVSDPDTINRLSSCVLPLIMSLPETYQRPLILSELEGKKHKEVAETLGLSLSAVKSRILRGRKKLYESLQKCCTLYHDASGNLVDYKQKDNDLCNNCGN